MQEAIKRWQLITDGELIQTHTNQLLPVRFKGQMAMLKMAQTEEEQQGHCLMNWLDGHGAAQIYAHDGPALLMERLNTEPSLSLMATTGQDTQAT